LPNIRWLLAAITWIHRWIFLTSNGRLGGRALGFRFLLLENVGRRSGRRYQTPLLYLDDAAAGGLVVTASNAGDPRNPDWLGNLHAHPEAVAVRLNRRRIPVGVRVVEDPERGRLWERLCGVYPFYPRYERRAGRPIPILVLEPRSEAQ